MRVSCHFLFALGTLLSINGVISGTDISAPPGKYFQYRLAKDEVVGAITNVHGDWSSWLDYDQSCHCLQGVPLVKSSQPTDNSITQVEIFRQSCLTCGPRKLNVRLSDAAQPGDVITALYTKCMSADNPVSATLRFGFSTSVDKIRRVQLLRNIAKVLNIDIGLIKLASRAPYTNVLQSGAGEAIANHEELVETTDVSWVLACNSEVDLVQEMIRAVDRSVKKSEFLTATGHPVVSWFVMSQRRQARTHRRLKRSLSALASLSCACTVQPTLTPFSTMPTTQPSSTDSTTTQSTSGATVTPTSASTVPSQTANTEVNNNVTVSSTTLAGNRSSTQTLMSSAGRVSTASSTTRGVNQTAIAPTTPTQFVNNVTGNTTNTTPQLSSKAISNTTATTQSVINATSNASTTPAQSFTSTNATQTLFSSLSGNVTSNSTLSANSSTGFTTTPSNSTFGNINVTQTQSVTDGNVTTVTRLASTSESASTSGQSIMTSNPGSTERSGFSVTIAVSTEQTPTNSTADNTTTTPTRPVSTATGFITTRTQFNSTTVDTTTRAQFNSTTVDTTTQVHNTSITSTQSVMTLTNFTTISTPLNSATVNTTVTSAPFSSTSVKTVTATTTVFNSTTVNTETSAQSSLTSGSVTTTPTRSDVTTVNNTMPEQSTSTSGSVNTTPTQSSVTSVNNTMPEQSTSTSGSVNTTPTQSNATSVNNTMPEQSTSTSGSVNTTPTQSSVTSVNSTMPEQSTSTSGSVNTTPTQSNATSVNSIMPEQSTSTSGSVNTTPTQSSVTSVNNTMPEQSTSTSGGINTTPTQSSVTSVNNTMPEQSTSTFGSVNTTPTQSNATSVNNTMPEQSTSTSGSVNTTPTQSNATSVNNTMPEQSTFTSGGVNTTPTQFNATSINATTTAFDATDNTTATSTQSNATSINATTTTFDATGNATVTSTQSVTPSTSHLTVTPTQSTSSVDGNATTVPTQVATSTIGNISFTTTQLGNPTTISTVSPEATSSVVNITTVTPTQSRSSSFSALPVDSTTVNATSEPTRSGNTTTTVSSATSLASGTTMVPSLSTISTTRNSTTASTLPVSGVMDNFTNMTLAPTTSVGPSRNGSSVPVTASVTMPSSTIMRSSSFIELTTTDASRNENTTQSRSTTQTAGLTTTTGLPTDTSLSSFSLAISTNMANATSPGNGSSVANTTTPMNMSSRSFNVTPSDEPAMLSSTASTDNASALTTGDPNASVWSNFTSPTGAPSSSSVNGSSLVTSSTTIVSISVDTSTSSTASNQFTSSLLSATSSTPHPANETSVSATSMSASVVTDSNVTSASTSTSEEVNTNETTTQSSIVEITSEVLNVSKNSVAANITSTTSTDSLSETVDFTGTQENGGTSQVTASNVITNSQPDTTVAASSLSPTVSVAETPGGATDEIWTSEADEGITTSGHFSVHNTNVFTSTSSISSSSSSTPSVSTSKATLTSSVDVTTNPSTADMNTDDFSSTFGLVSGTSPTSNGGISTMSSPVQHNVTVEPAVNSTQLFGNVTSSTTNLTNDTTTRLTPTGAMKNSSVLTTIGSSFSTGVSRGSSQLSSATAFTERSTTTSSGLLKSSTGFTSIDLDGTTTKDSSTSASKSANSTSSTIIGFLNSTSFTNETQNITNISVLPATKVATSTASLNASVVSSAKTTVTTPVTTSSTSMGSVGNTTATTSATSKTPIASTTPVTMVTSNVSSLNNTTTTLVTTAAMISTLNTTTATSIPAPSVVTMTANSTDGSQANITSPSVRSTDMIQSTPETSAAATGTFTSSLNTAVTTLSTLQTLTTNSSTSGGNTTVFMTSSVAMNSTPSATVPISNPPSNTTTIADLSTFNASTMNDNATKPTTPSRMNNTSSVTSTASLFPPMTNTSAATSFSSTTLNTSTGGSVSVSTGGSVSVSTTLRTTLTTLTNASTTHLTPAMTNTTLLTSTVATSSRIATSTLSTTIPTTTVEDQNPFTTNGLSDVTIKYGAFFYYKIPNDTFFDRQDGTTENLRLTLKQTAPASSWILLDGESQHLYGVPVEPFYTERSGNVSLILKATDSDGLSISTPLTIQVMEDQLKVSHMFVMHIRTDFALFTSEIHHTLWWMGNVTSYFNESMDVIRVLSVETTEQPLVVISWTNTTINNINPPYTCPLSLITQVLDKMRLPEFPMFLSQYLITSIEVRLQGVCEGFTLPPSTTPSLTTSSQSSTTPSFSTNVTAGASLSSTSSTSSTTTPNAFPIVVRPLPVLTVNIGQYFEYLIPEDLFVDMQSGSTRNLSLSLVDEAGQSLPTTSWVKFSTANQTVYGIAVGPYYTEGSVTNYTLIATDTELNRAETSLTIRVTSAALLRVSHVFTMNILTDYQLFTNDLSHTLWWAGNISSYFNGDINDITILSITDRQPGLDISWSNNTINNVDPPYNCPLSLIFFNLEELKSEGFVSSLNQFTIGSITLRLQGVCQGLSTSTTTQSTSTTTPVTSTSTTTSSTTTTTPSTTSTSTTTPNPAPIVAFPLPTQTVALGVYFEYIIPENTFADLQDGSTRNLSLALLDGDKQAIVASSWLRFSAANQTVYGIAVGPYYTEGSVTNYTLIATDTEQNRAETSLTIRVTSAALLRVSHVFTMNILTDYQLFTNDLSHTLWWAGNISSYFNGDINDITILSITDRQPGLDISWSNNTINNVDPPYNCPLSLIFFNLQELKSEGFVSSLNQFTIGSITLRLQGVCQGLSTSTTTQSTSTTTPVTSTSTTTSSTTTTTPSTTSTSTTTPNPAPVVVSPPLTLTVSSGVYFEYLIPEDTFFDLQDGNTRNLSLSLLDANNQGLAQDSWLRFSAANQTVYGIAVGPYYIEESVTNYTLIATDTELNRVETSLTIRVTSAALLRVSHVFTMNILTDYQLFTNDLSHTLWWAGNISSYFNGDINDITILSITDRQPGLDISWSNNTINNVDPPYNCPLSLIFFNLEELKSEGFVRSLNQFTIGSITLRLQGVCQGLSTSTTTQSTSTTTPVTSTSTTTSSTTTTTPSTTSTSTTTPNPAPVVVSPPLTLTVSSGVYFEYLIPEDTFFDLQDGNTRNLSLSLLDVNNQGLAQDSWVKFSAANQTVYGIAVGPYYTEGSVTNYTLIATDTEQNRAETSLTIRVTSAALLRVSHVFTMNILTDYQLFTNDLSHTLWWAGNISSYFNGDINDITILSITDRQPGLDISWSNNTINNVDPPYNCPLSLIFFNLEELKSEGFVRSLNQFTIGSITLRLQGVCQGLSTSTTTQSTSTTTPVTSTSTTTSSTTTTTPSTTSTSTTTPNPMPMVASLLQTLTVSSGVYFEYLIPEETFLDLQDGNTRNLSLSMVDSSGQSLALNSWVQFNSSNQNINGIALAPYWNAVYKSTYTVIATDSSGNSVSTGLSVEVEDKNLLRVSHSYLMRIVTDYPLFTSELNHALWWLGNVTNSLGTDRTSITMTQLTEGSVVVGWSNNSINNVEPLYKCPGSLIYQQFRGFDNGSLQASLPQYTISSIDLRLQGVCSEYTTSTTTSTSTTSTTTPTTSTSTTSTSTSTTSTTPSPLPVVLNNLPDLHMQVGVYQEYKVPESTFFDYQDGATRQLTLSLLDANAQVLISSNWLQLNAQRQLIYGLAVFPYFTGQKNETYMLRATDRDGLSTVTPLTVYVGSEELIKVSHIFTMSIITDFTLFTTSVDHIVWWTGNITNYFSQPNSAVTVLNITGPLVNIAWTNSSIASAYTCPLDEVNSLYQKMTSGDNTLQQSVPQYLVSSLQLHLVGICETFTISTVSIPTTSASISTTSSTMVSTSVAANSTLSSSAAMATSAPLQLTTGSSKRVTQIIVPIVVVLLLLIIIIVIIIIILRRKKKYKGKSHFDGEGNLFTARSPVVIGDDEEDEVDPPYNELYAAETFTDDTLFPPAAVNVHRAPPPRYHLPPPFPSVKDKSNLESEIGPL